jgi:hypothetical protein
MWARLCVVVAVGYLGAACAAGVASTKDDGAGGEGVASSSSQQSVGSGGSGGTSVGGSTSTGTAPLPCGIDCSTIQVADCQEAKCNESTKQCEIGAVADGAGCEDGLFCTLNDSCQEGACVGGPANDCGITASDCEDVSCDEASKMCSTQAKADGASCQNSGDLCLVNTTCQGGLCLGITKDCFFQPVPNECHTSVCNPQNGQCEPQADASKDGSACVDTTDPCVVNKTCAQGMCTGGVPKDCSSLTMGCTKGICDPVSGMCQAQAIMQGQLCDDLDACTTGEICNAGMCAGGTAVSQCSGQTKDGCCPSTCNDQNDADCGGFDPMLFPVALSPSNYGLGDIDIDANGDLLAVTGTPRNVWKVSRATGMATILASNVCSGSQLLGVAHRAADNLIYVSTNTGAICSVTYQGTSTQVTNLNKVVNALAVAPAGFGSFGGQLIAANQDGTVVAIDPAGPTLTTVASGAGGMSDLAFGPTGVLYVSGATTIKTVASTGGVSSFLTTTGAADGIAVDPDNSRLFIADSSGDSIKQVTLPGKQVTTLFAANIDNGYYVAGIIHDKESTLIYATGETSYTLQAATP